MVELAEGGTNAVVSAPMLSVAMLSSGHITLYTMQV